MSQDGAVSTGTGRARAADERGVSQPPVLRPRSGRVKGMGKMAVPIGVVAIVLMLVVPLPAALIDMLLAINITASLLILLVAMQIKKPLDFAVFPSLLLVATLFRLSLNVSSTRLVLTDGYAGKVIEAFGHFVIGGSLVVGLVIFLILTIVQFVVITNGAGRVAEVGARFTLDAMPGKQMAIDADLNAGLINEAQARRRRHEVTAEADFYGSMDGASKFVKGDAIAGIIVTLVNLIGGFAIGVMQRGMEPGEAVSTFSLLTVGDGLVSMIPALLMSTATGIIVTRSATEGDMGTDLLAQLGRFKQPMRIAGGAAIALCLIPGLPKLPFLIIGGAFLFMASRMTETPVVDEEAEAAAAALENEPKPDSPEAIAEKMRVDPLELEVAFDLVDLVDPARGGDLLDRVKALRRKVAMDTGLVIPLVRTRDNLDLPGSQYVIWLNGVPAAKGISPAGTILAIGDNLDGIPGKATREPVFGLAAKWVPGGAAAAGGDGRRDRRRPLVGHHDAPRRGRPAERRGPARPRGRAPAGRDGPPDAPHRRRGTDPHPAHPGRGATRVARVARRGCVDPGPGAHLRGTLCTCKDVHRPRRSRRGGTGGAGLGDQPSVRDARRAPPRLHPRARLRAAAPRVGPAERRRPGPGPRRRRRSTPWCTAAAACSRRPSGPACPPSWCARPRSAPHSRA